MEFAENNRISHRQLYRQMILGFLAPFWLCMSGRGKLNGVDAVIGTVIAVVLLCFYVVFLILCFDFDSQYGCGENYRRFI